MWNLKNKNLEYDWKAHNNTISSLSINNKHDFLLTSKKVILILQNLVNLGSHDGYIKLWKKMDK